MNFQEQNFNFNAINHGGISLYFFPFSFFGFSQPISLHPENPHYFLYEGKPTILVTSGAFSLNEAGLMHTFTKAYRIQGWRYLMSGGALYNNLDFTFQVGHENDPGKA